MGSVADLAELVAGILTAAVTLGTRWHVDAAEGRLDPPIGCVATVLTRNLRTAQSRHLIDVAPHQAPRRFALCAVFLYHQ
jgi:hypothetical protein